MLNKNCLSYWFPKLSDRNIPTPRTLIFESSSDPMAMCGILDGEESKEFTELVERVKTGILNEQLHTPSLKFPLFLRTGLFSGKHRWRETCLLPDMDVLGQHMFNLIEMSHLVDIMGLAHNVWVVREMLPTHPLAILPRYGGFPLVKEVRAFVAHGQIQCVHPYWPLGAIRDGLSCTHGKQTIHERKSCEPCIKEALALFKAADPKHDEAKFMTIVHRVAMAFRGEEESWSVDLLETNKGWYVTDMALADVSYHYPGCPFGRE